MAIYRSTSQDPYENLAIEEVIFKDKSIDEDIFLLWRNTEAFIVGRNQNPFLEINPEYFHESIPIIRRISGGGTIYQDLGTINFSFITNDYQSKINNYRHFLNPIMDALKSLGIKVKFRPKSHLFINQGKVSGNAQAYSHRRLLHHGTLLFDSDVLTINQALVNTRMSSETMNVSSNRVLVTNIKNHTTHTIDIIEEAILTHVKNLPTMNPNVLVLSDKQRLEAKKLVETKYKTDKWNIHRTLDFIFTYEHNDDKIPLVVKHGIIEQVHHPNYQFLKGIRYASKEFLKRMKI